MHIIRLLPAVLKQAFKIFRKNEPLRMAGATAFFASFALPAILMILIQIFGLIVDPRTMSQHLFQNLSGIIGKNTVDQLRETLRNVRHLADTWYIAAGGFLFLIFVSTTLFKVIKDSLNQLWNITLADKPGIKLHLEDRARSFIAIMLAGILFLGVLMAEGVITLFRQYLYDLLPQAGFWLSGFVNQLVSLVVVTIWFTMVFKFLPDGRPEWRVTVAGGFFTGLLFTVGKLILRVMLSYGNMHTIYGASTSIVLLLLFIFYSSFMFYYGACFTRAWAERTGCPIRPASHAVKYELSRIELQPEEDNG